VRRGTDDFVLHKPRTEGVVPNSLQSLAFWSWTSVKRVTLLASRTVSTTSVSRHAQCFSESPRASGTVRTLNGRAVLIEFESPSSRLVRIPGRRRQKRRRLFYFGCSRHDSVGRTSNGPVGRATSASTRLLVCRRSLSRGESDFRRRADDAEQESNRRERRQLFAPGERPRRGLIFFSFFANSSTRVRLFAGHAFDVSTS